MSDPERRKRIEALRRKKQELEKLRLQSETNKTEEKEKTVDEIAKEALESAKNMSNFEMKDIEKTNNFMNDIMKKKFLSSLKESHYDTYWTGGKPEMYDEACQWVEEDEYDDDDSVDDNKEKKPKKIKQYIVHKHKIIKESEKDDVFDNRPKEYLVIPEDKRKEFVDKKQEEIIEIINDKKKIMERALNEDNMFKLFNNNEMEINNSDKLVYPLYEFFDELCAKRIVTNLSWSLKHPELLLSAFSKSNDFNVNQQNGLIILWSLAMRKVPEYVFTCQAEVTSAIFHSYNPKLIIGGTYTGQVLIWDTRGKQMPVMKTPLGIGSGNSGMKTHSAAISCLGVVGSTNSNHIISVSNGVICTWSLANLSKPVKRIELIKKKSEEKGGLDEIGCLSMGLAQFETNSLLIGSDDNNIYQISLHGNENTGNILSTFKGHEAPVYSVDVHPGDYFNTCNFSHLFISSSADWTTRLWSKTQPDEPLMTIDSNEDYVYSSRWCPTNSSVICCGDGSGHLDFWDFNKDLETPLHRLILEKSVINQLAWSEDGKRLAVGEDSGKVNLLGISSKIYKSSLDDSLKFEKNVGKLKMNK